MPSKGQRKYADRIPFIVEAYQRGVPIEEIEIITEISDTTITRILKEKGIDIRRRGRPTGKTYKRRDRDLQ